VIIACGRIRVDVRAHAATVFRELQACVKRGRPRAIVARRLGVRSTTMFQEDGSQRRSSYQKAEPRTRSIVRVLLQYVSPVLHCKGFWMGSARSGLPVLRYWSAESSMSNRCTEQVRPVPRLRSPLVERLGAHVPRRRCARGLQQRLDVHSMTGHRRRRFEATALQRFVRRRAPTRPSSMPRATSCTIVRQQALTIPRRVQCVVSGLCAQTRCGLTFGLVDRPTRLGDFGALMNVVPDGMPGGARCLVSATAAEKTRSTRMAEERIRRQSLCDDAGLVARIAR